MHTTCFAVNERVSSVSRHRYGTVRLIRKNETNNKNAAALLLCPKCNTKYIIYIIFQYKPLRWVLGLFLGSSTEKLKECMRISWGVLLSWPSWLSLLASSSRSGRRRAQSSRTKDSHYFLCLKSKSYSRKKQSFLVFASVWAHEAQLYGGQSLDSLGLLHCIV